MSICKRVSDITPFQVMEVLEAAQCMECEGRDIVHLEIGEPDFDTPECIKRAACEALDRGATHYTHSLGIIELRKAIAEDYKKRCGVDVDPDRIIVTQGTSPAMFVVFSTILSEGDSVVVSDPCYACYTNFIEFAGGRAVRVPVAESDGFQYRASDIRTALDESTRAILINSPANPTGTILSEERMREIASLGVQIVSDEIYQGLEYEGRAHSILEYTDDAFVLNGFSKLYAMTGWRLGYIIAPEKYIRPMQKLCQNFFISANAPAQWAGVAALKEAAPDVERMLGIYDRRRKYMLERLTGMGFTISSRPNGAFYILVNVGALTNDSYALAFDILEKAGVGVTPGIDFGEGAREYIRFSYAASMERITEGMDRLEKYLAECHPGKI